MRRPFLHLAIQRVMSAISSPGHSRRHSTFRGSLETLESRALLSAASCNTLLDPADIPGIAAEVSVESTTAKSSAVTTGHGKGTAAADVGKGTHSKATPRAVNVAGDHDFSSSDLGNGTLTITQNGLAITGVVTADNLTSGSFAAQFKNDRARKAKGTAEFLYNGDEVAVNFNFQITFFKNGDLKRFKYS